MGCGRLAVVVVAGLMAGCAIDLFPAYDAEPIPFPAGVYEHFSAGNATGFGLVEDAGQPGPRITPDRAVQLAGVEIVPAPPEEIIGVMRRAKLDRDGEVTHTAWLVAFSSGPIVAIDDQTGEVIVVECCVDDLRGPPLPSP